VSSGVSEIPPLFMDESSAWATRGRLARAVSTTSDLGERSLTDPRARFRFARPEVQVESFWGAEGGVASLASPRARPGPVCGGGSSEIPGADHWLGQGAERRQFQPPALASLPRRRRAGMGKFGHGNRLRCRHLTVPLGRPYGRCGVTSGCCALLCRWGRRRSLWVGLVWDSGTASISLPKEADIPGYWNGDPHSRGRRTRGAAARRWHAGSRPIAQSTAVPIASASAYAGSVRAARPANVGQNGSTCERTPGGSSVPPTSRRLSGNDG
jgi:hypothetical protein